MPLSPALQPSILLLLLSSVSSTMSSDEGACAEEAAISALASRAAAAEASLAPGVSMEAYVYSRSVAKHLNWFAGKLDAHRYHS